MLKLHWVTKHAEVLENEAMNKMINDAYDLSLLLTECQCTEVDWSSSWVLSWHFEFNLIQSWVAHIFNSTQIELSIFST